MISKSNITFVVFARDEAQRIPYLLKNFQSYGDILIMLDDRTVDNTAEIAESFGARVYKFKNVGWTEDENTVNLVFGLVKTPWLYWAYVDELLPRSLLEKMVELSNQNQYEAIWMKRKNYHYGGVNLQNSPTLRFFKKGAIDFSQNKIGEFGKIVAPKEKVLFLPQQDNYAIHHFSTYDLNKFELAHNKYSNLEAKMNFDQGIKFSSFKLIFKPIYYFLRYLIAGGAWRRGWQGIIIAANYAFFFFNTQAKMWELENKVNIDSIEKKYDELKEKILKELEN